LYKGRKDLKKFIIYMACALVVLYGSTWLVNAADKQKAPAKAAPAAPANNAAPAAAAKPAQPKAGGANPITQAFVSKGVLNCTSRINQVTSFLTNSSVSKGAFLFMSDANPDNQMVSTSIEVINADKKSAYTSATFAPNQAIGCGALYEAISWWPDKCEVVANKQFAGKKATSKLKQNIEILDIGPTSRVFLMPTGDGCISIKKELVQ